MRTVQIIMAIIAFAFFAPIQLSASTAVSAKESREVIIKKVMEQKETVLTEKLASSKLMKKAKRLSQFFGKGEQIDLKSEPDKWMWFWIFGWSAAILLSIMSVFTFGAFAYLGWLCGVAGTVCLIIWLLKKTGSI
jgi:Flp pilus assembly protein TadB